MPDATGDRQGELAGGFSSAPVDACRPRVTELFFELPAPRIRDH